MSGTALTPALVSPSREIVVEARLRHVLDEMASALDRAHMADRRMAVLHLAVARGYAFLAAVPDKFLFRIESVGASMRTGPYAGLGVLANVISAHGPNVTANDICELAEVSWHSRNLMEGVSPFADEIHHGPYQEAVMRLMGRLGKGSGTR